MPVIASVTPEGRAHCEAAGITRMVTKPLSLAAIVIAQRDNDPRRLLAALHLLRGVP
jgi:hypothetical protein